MAYSTRSQLHMLHDRIDEAIDWGLRAIALAEQMGETETRVHALNNVGTALLLSGRPGGRERMEESLALALEHGFHEHAARAYTNFAEYAVIFKDFALAERILAEGIAFDTRHDLDAWTALSGGPAGAASHGARPAARGRDDRARGHAAGASDAGDAPAGPDRARPGARAPRRTATARPCWNRR